MASLIHFVSVLLLTLVLSSASNCKKEECVENPKPIAFAQWSMTRYADAIMLLTEMPVQPNAWASINTRKAPVRNHKGLCLPGRCIAGEINIA